MVVAAGNETTLSGETKVRAINGVYRFNEFTVTSEPGKEARLSVITLAIDVTQPSTEANKINLTASMRQ
jgi:hypothetical protein